MFVTNTLFFYCRIGNEGELIDTTPFFCSCYKKTIRTPQDKGVTIAQSTIIRTTDNIIRPSTGDLILFEAPTPELVSEVALKKAGAITIKAITNNQRGHCPHWKMEAV